MMLACETLSISVNRPWKDVYEFGAQPGNFALWADGMGENLRIGMGGIWLADTPSGPVEITFSPRNEYGVLDHTVRLLSGRVHVPLRVVTNGEGCEVMLTVFRQAEMSDEDFRKDLAAVRRDLAKLKGILEKDVGDPVVHVDFTKRK